MADESLSAEQASAGVPRDAGCRRRLFDLYASDLEIEGADIGGVPMSSS